MAIIETCLVMHDGQQGWGLICEGVLCPTISLCKSEAVAAGMAQYLRPGHEIRRWADDNHSHDATVHPSVPWNKTPWPPGSADKIVRAAPPKEIVATLPTIGDLPPAAVIEAAPERKSLLVRRPLVKPPPVDVVAAHAPEPERVPNGVLIPTATLGDVTPPKLTLAQKLAMRKAQGL